MSKRSKKSSASRTNARKKAEQPFDPAILIRATKTAREYRLILEANDQVGYLGSAVEMPTVFAGGASPDDCVKATRQALAIAVATILESGQRPPTPALRGKRETQVNIRLTADEKFLLVEAAHRMGFRGVSDLVRTAAIERVKSA